MTIIIQAPATVGIDVITAGIVPGPTPNSGTFQNLVAFNLGRGFNAAVPPLSQPAFTFSGHVGVTFDPGDPARDFTFGWLQFMKQVTLTLTYAGREDSEGQIDVSPLPLIGTRFLIDVDPVAGSAFSPFAQDPANPSNFTFDAVLGQAIANLRDHPMAFLPQSLFNTATRFENFLFSVVDIRKFVSIFSVRDKFGRFTPLAHVTSDLVYNGTFKWRARTAVPVTNLSSFSVGSSVKGAPVDGEVAALVKRASPGMSPAYNPTAQAALRNPSARRFLDHYEAAVPPLFFIEGRGSEDIP